MSEQSEISYLDGDIVWVKLGSCFWPGEVVGPEKLPPDLLPSFRKPPIAVVKFFNEDSYEYVKNLNSIFHYNCSRKNEFINKGLYMYRTKHGPMEKFPEDVIRAETAVGGDIAILTRDEFQETKKESYAGLFGDPKKTPLSSKKGKGSSDQKLSTPMKKLQGKTNYKVHILLQGSKTPSQNQPAESVSTPSTSRAGSEPPETQDKPVENKIDEVDKPEKPELPFTPSVPSTPTMSGAGQYACHACQFTTTRLNVLILHNKTHSISYTPYTPSPIKKKVIHKTPKSTPVTSKTPKPRKPRQEKPEKVLKKSQSKKRAAEAESTTEVKKPKTDEEIKSSLLADWDDGDEESNDESAAMVMARSPEVPVAAESPAVPTPAELPRAEIPEETLTFSKKKFESTTTTTTTITATTTSSTTAAEKPESSSDSKYEFCEDEDWPVEADIGRKIPRVKNPSKRKSETKSISIDDDEMAREVAELLNKTTVPELPSAPEPLKVEENFPEPSIVKSPDKQLEKPQNLSSPEKKTSSDTPPPKTIFKTKTFFRSRHSRSQDAIGKYVAEQLNAAERMDLTESELNGSDVVSPLEIRISPPIEHVKVARLAPKIQLKKMKAEAAQLREKEKYHLDKFKEDSVFNIYNSNLESTNIPNQAEEKENSVTSLTSEIEQNIITNRKLEKSDEICVSTDIPKVHNTDKEDISNKNLNPEINKTTQNNEEESLIEDEKSKTNLETDNNSVIKFKSSDLEKSYELEKTYVSYEHINESTASAVDALLSVSRETDRVTKVISDDPPEDLFEEDIKDNSSLNGFSTSYQPIDENNDKNLISTGSECAVAQPNTKLNVDTTDEESNNFSTVLPEPSNNSDCIIDVQDAPVVNENPIEELNENTIEELNENPIEEIIENPIEEINENPIEELNENPIEEIIENPIQEVNDNTIEEVIKNPIEEIIKNPVNDVTHSLPSKNDIDEVGSDTINLNNDIADTVSLPSKNESEGQASHTLLSKIENEDVVGHVLPSDNDTIPDVVSKDLNECYPSDTTLSESDLQIAEALINLPTTTLHKKSSVNHIENNTLMDVASEDIQLNNENSFKNISKHDIIEDINSGSITSLQENFHTASNDNIKSRFETEQEKCENLNAAKSLVQMSESIDHKIKIPDIEQPNTKEILSILRHTEDDVNMIGGMSTKSSRELMTKINSEVDHKITNNTNEFKQNLLPQQKSIEFDSRSSKLLKILEEPCVPKVSSIKKQVIMPGKEKILNFEVGKSIVKPKLQSPKQKIIIRRTAPNKTLLNNITEVSTPDKIILSRTSKPALDGSPVQTYTIQTTPEPPPTGEGNTIIIQQKIRKISKPMSKLQKIKPPLQTSALKSVISIPESKRTQELKKDDSIFDINSMPVVLSDDILTPESIEKMPIVMTDGNIISHSNNTPKILKTKQGVLENEKMAINAVQSTKSEIKTLLMNSSNEVSKITTPNILTKSSKLRGAKPMLVIDKVTGKQKIIMTKPEPPVKEIKQPQTIIQAAPQSSAKGEKFIILPTQSSPRPGKTQKIVIDPQTGKAHVLVGKGAETPLNVSDNKPVAAKLLPPTPDVSAPGNTVMIITNAQGAQSRIVLTPEHEKILFPNKQQNVPQLKTVTHRVTSGASAAQKATTIQNKTPTRIVSKQKSAIITSKGQLIVGGRIATPTQNIAPMPEIRPAPKRILAAEPKKLVQTVQKNTPERLIFLQQKSGTVMQLTAAQFEHLQRTGQIIQKAAPQEKHKVQKSIAIPSNETVVVPAGPKQRVRKSVNDAPTPPKKVKHEIAIAPSITTITPIPALTPLSNTYPSAIANAPSTLSSASSTNYSDLDNIEELLPSTAIAKQDSRLVQPEIPAQAPAPLSDPGQLLAVPGEHFGGPPGSFYLCVEENGTFTVIDNRPLVLENNQLVPMPEPLPVLAQPERRDILEAALANSDVFHADTAGDNAPDFRDLNANVSVHCRVSETSTTLNQPIMTPVEVPSKVDSEPAMPSTIEDGLAVIGVTPLTVPTSLELPITVTDPRIAPKTTDPLSNNNYGAPLLPSPNTEMTFATTEQMEVSVVGPISMPLLTEEDAVGKSMPILTDEVADRTISSVESTVGSPSSIDVRESETEDSAQWSRRLLTPCSDTSETSAEIPLQPVMQLSAKDISPDS
ncbi:titin homolog [Bicyclus anynana]|uniref:Titin homolog n=1 Tax=Bicyclus anynana TaxID=110368 RepID=A0A6J1NHT1_BICAN|nr:titin homolog [Bicyclus anynana]